MQVSKEKIAELIIEDLITLLDTIFEDDSFNVAENWIRRPRKHSENTLKDSKARKNIKIESSGNIFKMYYPDYLEYVNYGRHPSTDPSKKPPIKAIIEWCKEKLGTTDNKVVYAVRNTVWKYGIKPRPVVSLFVQNLDYLWEKEISEKLFNSLITDLNNYFSK